LVKKNEGNRKEIMNFEIIHSNWSNFLIEEKQKKYFQLLVDFLDVEFDSFTIFPPKELIFKSLEIDSTEIKVVILGQDPYPTKNHANGLSFSVNKEIQPLPKSLVNIFKEIKKEYPSYNPINGDLEHWLYQGVFLLNTILTIREGEPLSHQKKGWEEFTSNITTYLSNNHKNIVFLLWGKNAHNYESFISNPSEHLIIKTSHPSPLGYTKNGKDFHSFKDSGQFHKTNQYLIANKKTEIHW
jgi:uracil-DNA glycosylase